MIEFIQKISRIYRCSGHAIHLFDKWINYGFSSIIRSFFNGNFVFWDDAYTEFLVLLLALFTKFIISLLLAGMTGLAFIRVSRPFMIFFYMTLYGLILSASF